MFQVSVEETFAAGHALRGYRGKCENVHGHNYKIHVILEGPSLNSIGLLYDFKDLKEAIQRAIRKLDHRFLNEIPPFDVVNPSAENLAKYLYEEVSRLLEEAGSGNAGAPCNVRRVTVWETETTKATYFADGSGPGAGAS
ncbi:MAG: 6-carboxytetrahydropterin synthase QueD [Acidobacteria bacterium RIFCSPLOWO2_12_FULL_60_22]|nr:MAG: 6-carboxytetrahydropterin synthase QueD [Acidobacteria bacterium RIFCSPLOWO2_12_FULL_60_22]